MKKLSYKLPAWPYFAEDEIEAVVRVLRSGKVNYWTGQECKNFEKEFADFIGCPYAISLANGTVALELALYALGIGPGDDVIVPCRTFIASASCVIARGARPIVADIDPVTQNITAETARQVLTSNTKAIIVVHLAGCPCEMDAILDFAAQYNLKVIEDCAQAHGAQYREKYVGAFGDAAAFSFCQDKIMTTGGEGGMLLLKNKDVWQRAWSYKDHGKNANMTVQDTGTQTSFRWVHDSFGTNFRMTEIQAAIGRLQLQKLPFWLETRRRNAKLLHLGLQGNSALSFFVPSSHIQHAYYKYYVFLESKALNFRLTRDEIVTEINACGVPCATGSCGEIYLEKAFTTLNLQPATRYANAKDIAERSIVFLVHPTLTENNILDVCEVVNSVIQC